MKTNVYFITIYMILIFICSFGLKLKTEHDFRDLVCVRDAFKIKLSINVTNKKRLFLSKNVTITMIYPGK